MKSTVVVAVFALALGLVVSGACSKKSTPPPETSSDAGGGADAGVSSDAGASQDAGAAVDAGACIRQNCATDPDCAGLGPDGGNLHCVILPATGSGNFCQRTCSGDGGSCGTGKVCQSGRCADEPCSQGGCGQGLSCRAYPTPSAICLPSCSQPGNCCTEDDAECLANADCDGGRCTWKPCAAQSACDVVDAGLSCVSYIGVFPSTSCTSNCANTAECTAMAAAASVAEKFLCQ